MLTTLIRAASGPGTAVGRRLAPALVLALAPLLAPAQTAAVHADGTCTTSGSQVQCTFAYTGAAQTWTVPTGVTSATFVVRGAQGGAGFDGRGFVRAGLGGEATGTLTVTPG